MAKKITHEEFVKYVKNFDTLNEFDVVGKYINNETKIKIHHKICGRDFDIRPADFKRRRRCSPCNRKDKLTTKDFTKYVLDKTSGEYTLLSEYTRDKDKVLMRHNECGHKWYITPGHFKEGRRCPRCAGIIKKTTIEFKIELRNILGNDYILLEEYKGANNKIKIMHKNELCGHHIFETTPSNVHRGRGCPKCSLIYRSGEYHFRYNDSLTPQDRKNDERLSYKYKKWKKRVFSRYNYTCDNCGKYGGNMHAHHMESWDKNIDKRFNVGNGVLLCVDCHLNFHKEYGFGSNTKQQYIEYKNNYSC